ncbi:hypothetical protein BBJ28_00007317 [Nothophytophthora sp. Chile5]|nr:hypothetical protein BBJ28_00007317 [Nothophytophthora sp. Chile5]
MSTTSIWYSSSSSLSASIPRIRSHALFCLHVWGYALLIQYLWARDERDLEDTAQLARSEWRQQAESVASGGSGTLRTFLQAVDLSDSAEYTPKIDAVLLQLQAEQYDRVFLVHNAGSLGTLGLVQESVTSPADLAKYWELNVTSVLWLNKRFLDVFGASRDELLASPPPVATERAHARLVIVNITSLCGIEPFKTHMLYCTGKAAREMHHRVLAAEQAASGKVRVLSYSPGPMDTDMQQTIRESPRVDSELRQQYADMKTQGTLIPPAQSSRRGVKLAVSGDFETGDHVDYYDLDVSNGQ